jgi:hypothetical protein
VLPSSVPAIRAALERGVTVFLATGKARPAAIRAMEAVGLAGEGLVVSSKGPGVFLQGGQDREWNEHEAPFPVATRSGGLYIWERCSAASIGACELPAHTQSTPAGSHPPPTPSRFDSVRTRRAADCGRAAAG